MRLDRPIGAFLLLWPALWALWIAAEGVPDLPVLLVFLAGVVVMRSAGCVINDYADRNFDAHVQRTRHRPLAAKRIRPGEALGLFVALCLLAFLLVLQLNWRCILLSVVALLLAASYPFMKRYHYWPQAHLGAAFGWAVPMAFAAQTDAVPAVGWLLFVVTLIWAVCYDTLYAMVDREDDLKIGLRSTAILFGRLDRALVAVIQIVFLLGLFLVGRAADLGIVYQIALLVAAGLLAYQQYLIRHREPAACFKAFLNNNWVGLIVFLGIFGHFLVAGP
jgi:4-hydroxybenzoate polyprenyltransferase